MITNTDLEGFKRARYLLAGDVVILGDERDVVERVSMPATKEDWNHAEVYYRSGVSTRMLRDARVAVEVPTSVLSWLKVGFAYLLSLVVAAVLFALAVALVAALVTAFVVAPLLTAVLVIMVIVALPLVFAICSGWDL